MEDRLERRIDRATLVFWRALNVLGWAAFAVFVAVVMHETIFRLVAREYVGMNLNERPDPIVPMAGLLGVRFALKATASLLIGVAIGAIVGAKVWKRQPIVAAAAALGYVLISVFFLEFWVRTEVLEQSGGVSRGLGLAKHGLGGSGWSAVWYDLVGIVAIMVAALWAKRVARHRI